MHLRWRRVCAWIFCVCTLGLSVTSAQTAPPGRGVYQSKCAFCHGGDGNGGERAPGIVERLSRRDDAQLGALIRNGLPAAGMPGFTTATDSDLQKLISYLRTLKPKTAAIETGTFPLTDGGAAQGTVLARGPQEVQLLTADHRIALLRKKGDAYRRVTSDADWSTYHGNVNGNRYSELSQINSGNASGLAAQWLFPVPGMTRLEVTPIVVDGVMYVTGPNQCYALDAGSGRKLWEYRRPRTKGVIGDAGGGINRGVAISGGRAFMVTDSAHLLALDRFTGALLWETEMADYRQNYGATSAPLIVGKLVISGHSGGDEGVRGFVAAFDQETGKEAWRFWTVPAPGEPAAATWKGNGLEHACATTWFTGTYDPQLNTVYWPTGNPCPDYNGDNRQGDNLYSDSVLALDPQTGKLKWHFQYTPHDVWDWDAQQPVVLIDAPWQGRERKLLLHANRNGFFYVLDRTSGEFLQATPLVQKLSWATGIGKDGRPQLVANQQPTAEGKVICPAVEGATNWYSTAYHPGTGLYYVQTLEKCTLFTKSPGKWEAGKSYYDGDTSLVPQQPGQHFLRAFDIQTGKPKWEIAQQGAADNWGGALATAGNLVFFGEDGGFFTAADAKSGEVRWRFAVNANWKASPMTYRFDGRQYVAIAAGGNIITFALPEGK